MNAIVVPKGPSSWVSGRDGKFEIDLVEDKDQQLPTPETLTVLDDRGSLRLCTRRSDMNDVEDPLSRSARASMDIPSREETLTRQVISNGLSLESNCCIRDNRRSVTGTVN